jgi:hypothetical protein
MLYCMFIGLGLGHNSKKLQHVTFGPCYHTLFLLKSMAMKVIPCVDFKSIVSVKRTKCTQGL